MYRLVAMTLLAFGGVSLGASPVGTMAGEPEDGAEPTSTDAAGHPAHAPAQSEAQTEARARAAARAVSALAEHLRIAPGDITVRRVEPRTWSDSSMGCRKHPGAVALTVITEGYAVSLSAQGRGHQVHVSDASAVVCDQLLMRRDARGVANARGLDVMMERARQDLAQRLGVDPSRIRLGGMQPHRWSDSGLDCPRAGESVQPGPVEGFKLSLRYAGRTYTYHTDRKDVRACPEVESG